MARLHPFQKPLSQTLSNPLSQPLLQPSSQPLSQTLSNLSLPDSSRIDKGFDKGCDKGSNKGGAAFTLLELLIAFAIMSVVLTAISGVFYGAMRLQTKSARSVEESLPVQQAVAILKRDFKGIVAPGGVLGG